MIPPNLPVFEGWRPIDSAESIRKDDCWVCIKASVMYAANTVPNPTHHEAKVSELHMQFESLDKIKPNSDWWLYRKVSYGIMPANIRFDPGWFPLPEDEVMKEGDCFFYRALMFKQPCTGQTIGQTMAACCKKIPLTKDSIAGWPFRYGQNFGSPGPAERTRNRLPPNPAQLTQELPLP